MADKDILRFKDKDGALRTPITKITGGPGVTIDRPLDSSNIYELDEVKISINSASTGSVGIEGAIREVKITNTTTIANAIKNAINALGVNTIANVIANIPAAASDERTFVIALNTAVDGEKAVANNNSGTIAGTKTAIDNVANAAATFLNASLAANPSNTTITTAEITQAKNDIRVIYNAAITDSGTVRATARDLNVAALYPTSASSILKSVYDSIAAAVKQVSGAMYTINGMGDGVSAGSALKAADNAAIDSIVNTGILIAPSLNTAKVIGLEKSLKLKDETITFGGCYTGDISAKVPTMDAFTMFFHKVTV